MGGDDRETVWLGKSEPGKVSEPRLASRDEVKQPERGMLGKRTKYIEKKKSEMFESTERERGG